MCKFDKNQSYSTRTVFEALNNKFPEEKEENAGFKKKQGDTPPLSRGNKSI